MAEFGLFATLFTVQIKTTIITKQDSILRRCNVSVTGLLTVLGDMQHITKISCASGGPIPSATLFSYSLCPKAFAPWGTIEFT
jgi:hypothetical protein